MSNERGGRPETEIDIVLHQHPRLDYSVVPVDAHTWAIHGYIPVDGEVILAEFDGREAAEAALAKLAGIQEVAEMRRTIAKVEAARVLRRAGYPLELIQEIHDQLEDPIDLDRDAEMLSRYGITRDELINRMEAAP